MKTPENNGIVADGRERWIAGGEVSVRARHAEALAKASFSERLRIERLIRQEIAEILARESPPPEALF